MADTISKEHRSWNMSRIRGSNTKPELTLRSLLHRTGLRFRLHDRSLPGRPDIVLKRYRTTIFVHGCFWHRHKGCANATTPSTRPDFWNEKFRQTIQRDERNVKKLREAGWRVITVWECELKKHPDEVLRDIRKTLMGRR